jgi:small multidrug resistance pump
LFGKAAVMGYVFLLGAIVSEVAATLSLRASEGFSKPLFGIVVVVGYVVAFAFLTLALARDLPLGVAYALWAAAGVAAVAILSIPLFGETINAIQAGGLLLVIAGVVAIEVGGAH